VAIEVVSFGSDQLRLRFTGQAGFGFTVYTSESLMDGGWMVLQRGAAVSQAGPVETAVEFSPTTAARFYRVSVP